MLQPEDSGLAITAVQHRPRKVGGKQSDLCLRLAAPLRIPVDQWSLLALARFALAFIVAVNHVGDYAPAGWLSFVPVFGAFEAVLGFLFISGYSIGSSYRKEPTGFLKRRAWRIYPVYIGAIALACVAAPVRPDFTLGVTLVQNLLFLNQITTGTSFVGPAWTLALEVWLYCLTPWLWRLKPSHLRVMTFVSFVAFCCYEFSRSAFHLKYYAGLGFGINLPLLSFAWLAGFALAREPATAGKTLRDAGLIFLGHVLLAAAIQLVHRFRQDDLWAFLESDTVAFLARTATLATVWLLFKWIVDGKVGRTPGKTMRLLGDISYPLYLVHASAFILISRAGFAEATTMVVAALSVSFFFHWLLDFYSRARERRPRSPAVQDSSYAQTILPQHRS
jgi:peptidoglycan/LPS O-acetylase OafA/YrhL